jgi:hypothetical protein
MFPEVILTMRTAASGERSDMDCTPISRFSLEDKSTDKSSKTSQDKSSDKSADMSLNKSTDNSSDKSEGNKENLSPLAALHTPAQAVRAILCLYSRCLRMCHVLYISSLPTYMSYLADTVAAYVCTMSCVYTIAAYVCVMSCIYSRCLRMCHVLYVQSLLTYVSCLVYIVAAYVCVMSCLVYIVAAYVCVMSCIYRRCLRMCHVLYI